MGKAELKLEIDADLLAEARAQEIQLALVIERALREAIGPDTAELRARRWATDHSDAIASYNQFVEETGAFGEEWRNW